MGAEEEIISRNEDTTSSNYNINYNDLRQMIQPSDTNNNDVSIGLQETVMDLRMDHPPPFDYNYQQRLQQSICESATKSLLLRKMLQAPTGANLGAIASPVLSGYPNWSTETCVAQEDSICDNNSDTLTAKSDFNDLDYPEEPSQNNGDYYQQCDQNYYQDNSLIYNPNSHGNMYNLNSCESWNQYSYYQNIEVKQNNYYSNNTEVMGFAKPLEPIELSSFEKSVQPLETIDNIDNDFVDNNFGDNGFAQLNQQEFPFENVSTPCNPGFYQEQDCNKLNVSVTTQQSASFYQENELNTSITTNGFYQDQESDDLNAVDLQGINLQDSFSGVINQQMTQANDTYRPIESASGYNGK